jgi:hypothetical protein
VLAQGWPQRIRRSFQPLSNTKRLRWGPSHEPNSGLGMWPELGWPVRSRVRSRRRIRRKMRVEIKDPSDCLLSRRETKFGSVPERHEPSVKSKYGGNDAKLKIDAFYAGLQDTEARAFSLRKILQRGSRGKTQGRSFRGRSFGIAGAAKAYLSRGARNNSFTISLRLRRV